jgi:hypothetical protein
VTARSPAEAGYDWKSWRAGYIEGEAHGIESQGARLEAVKALAEAARAAVPHAPYTGVSWAALLKLVAPQPEPDALVDCLVLPDASCTHPKCLAGFGSSGYVKVGYDAEETQ